LTDRALFDPGLQPERTALAWRRTALGIAVGAVLSFRLLPPVLGLWSIGVGVAGLLMSAATWTLAGRRARRVQSALLSSSGPLPGGGLPLFLTLIASGSAALGLVYIARR
jgi:putative membrane protein